MALFGADGAVLVADDSPPSGVLALEAECECGAKMPHKMPVIDLLQRHPLVLTCSGCGAQWGLRYKIGVDTTKLEGAPTNG